MVRRVPLSAADHRRFARGRAVRNQLVALGFLLPFAIPFVVFLLIPVARVFYLSLYKGGFTGERTYVGLDNFHRVVTQTEASAAVKNTALFALMSVPPTLLLALGLASCLTRIRRGAAVYRFLIYFPVLVPGVVAGLIWIFMTTPDSGLFNIVLRAFGIHGPVWLGPKTALPVAASLDVWRNVGYWTFFFVAAMVAIPRELYEAAHLDGVGAAGRFLHVTLPQMRRVLLFSVVVATIVGLQVFDTILVLTQGGPGTSTVTVVLFVYNYVFGPSLVGQGAAMSVLLLLAILTLTAIQMRSLRSRG